MRKSMINSSARPVSHTVLSRIIEAFVRVPPENRIYYVRRRGAECQGYPVFSDGTVCRRHENMAPDLDVAMLDPGDLGIGAGEVKMVD